MVAAVYPNGATTYLYDPEGRRVAKQANGAIQEQYLYDPEGTLTTTLGPDGKLIRGSQYGGGLHLADYTAGTGAGGGQTELRLMDSLGTLFIKLDQAANVLETFGQNAFGESLTCTPGLDYTETHFTDKLRDTESNLDYSGARCYISTLGRFTIPDFSGGADAIPYADLGNPQSLNLYSYAGNNPLGNSDPDGHKPCTGNDAASQPAGAGTPCDPKITAPTTTVNVHADLLDLSVLGQRAFDFASSAVQALGSYAAAPRDPGCMAGNAAGWRLTETSAIQRIEGRQDSFYTMVNSREAEVVVATYSGRKYLKADADGYAPNNLLALKECSNCNVIS